jgi:hypothetical protein
LGIIQHHVTTIKDDWVLSRSLIASNAIKPVETNYYGLLCFTVLFDEFLVVYIVGYHSDSTGMEENYWNP